MEEMDVAAVQDGQVDAWVAAEVAGRVQPAEPPTDDKNRMTPERGPGSRRSRSLIAREHRSAPSLDVQGNPW